MFAELNLLRLLSHGFSSLRRFKRVRSCLFQVPNRIFVGGISAQTTESELAQLFSAYGNVKATKIIVDRAGVSKGYGFVTFETEMEARRIMRDSQFVMFKQRKLNIAPAIKKQVRFINR